MECLQSRNHKLENNIRPRFLALLMQFSRSSLDTSESEKRRKPSQVKGRPEARGLAQTDLNDSDKRSDGERHQHQNDTWPSISCQGTEALNRVDKHGANPQEVAAVASTRGHSEVDIISSTFGETTVKSHQMLDPIQQTEMEPLTTINRKKRKHSMSESVNFDQRSVDEHVTKRSSSRIASQAPKVKPHTSRPSRIITRDQNKNAMRSTNTGKFVKQSSRSARITLSRTTTPSTDSVDSEPPKLDSHGSADSFNSTELRADELATDDAFERERAEAIELARTGYVARVREYMMPMPTTHGNYYAFLKEAGLGETYNIDSNAAYLSLSQKKFGAEERGHQAKPLNSFSNQDEIHGINRNCPPPWMHGEASNSNRPRAPVNGNRVEAATSGKPRMTDNYFANPHPYVSPYPNSKPHPQVSPYPSSKPHPYASPYPSSKPHPYVSPYPNSNQSCRHPHHFSKTSSYVSPYTNLSQMESVVGTVDSGSRSNISLPSQGCQANESGAKQKDVVDSLNRDEIPNSPESEFWDTVEHQEAE